MNFRNLLTLSKVVKNVNFIKLEKNDNYQKNNQNDHFCKVCVLDKVHKIHNETSTAYRTKMIEKRLHSDLFEGEKSLFNVESF